MADRPARRRRVGGGVALALTVLAGCANVPTGGAVQFAGQVPIAGSLDGPDVQVLPPAPQPGETPAAIVRGFLDASADYTGGHAVAREYLTAAAADSWNDQAGATVYAAAGLAVTTAGPAVVTATAPRLAEVAADGEYQPVGGTLRVGFTLTRVVGQWRIARPPPGLLLSQTDLERSYLPVPVYFLAPDRQTLVPDPVLFATRRAALPTAVIRRLLAGPGRRLAPSVSTAVPTGTALLGSVPVLGGVAEVNLSAEALRASARQLTELAAQVVWSLHQLPGVSAVRLTVDGSPVTVPGAVQPLSLGDLRSFDPDVVGGGAPGYYETAGRLAVLGGGPLLGPLGTGAYPLRWLSVSPDASRAAGVVATPDGQALYAGPVEGHPRAVVRGVVVLAPSWDVTNTLWTAVWSAGGWQVDRVAANGRLSTVPAPALLAAGTVQALRVSRDGTRVAAVVAGRLLVGVVAGGSSARRLSGFVDPLPAQDGRVLAVAWQDADDLVALVSVGRTGAVPVQVSVDGYTSSVLTGPTPGVPDEVAAAPGLAPLLVVLHGAVWRQQGLGWQQVAPGTSAAYPGG